MSADDNIVSLPVRPKANTGNLMLVPPPLGKCQHFNASFEVDVDAGECTCSKCGEKVSPIFVLQQLMHHESRWNRTREAYQEEMRRLEERSRTKCDHCGKMTRISHTRG